MAYSTRTCFRSFSIFTFEISLRRFYVLKTREQSDYRRLTLWQSFKYHLRSSLSKSNANGLKRNHSLYRGFWFSNLASIPIYGLYLGTYVYSKDRLTTSNNTLTRFYAPFIAGCIGMFKSSFFSSFSMLMSFPYS
jgi:hypothetical protein